MEQRTLEINLMSAKDLKDVNFISKMDVYAVVSISGDDKSHHQYSKQKVRSPVDRDGGTNPTWNFPIKFTVYDSPAAGGHNCSTLVFKLRCKRDLGDKDVGEVVVPIRELLDSAQDGKAMQFVSYQVRKPSGRPQGILNFSYKFGEKVPVPVTEKVHPKADQPVTAYPAAMAGPSSVPYVAPGPYAPHPPPPQPMAAVAGYGYPPPAQPYPGYPPPPPPQLGYGYPPPPYGYPPVQPGYGYKPPPPVQQPAKKNKFGMGLGAGLLGGMLGGLLIGDMVSDAGAYDAGYDAGFGDAGGF